MPRPEPAAVFAALGEPTRLRLVDQLGDGRRCSIASLARDLPMSRQALTKHLRALETAGLATAERDGRETLYRIDPAGLLAAEAWIGKVSAQWDSAIDRLKRHVEE
ncbi:MAG: metalloregulator ArsR/SmtB family transcription factor [Pseudomonadota bacterium]|nr:metalloregulator ArsR/SmtB family transcription factor [Pseudomonadota bacterium]